LLLGRCAGLRNLAFLAQGKHRGAGRCLSPVRGFHAFRDGLPRRRFGVAQRREPRRLAVVVRLGAGNGFRLEGLTLCLFGG
jgi:hypothetical protein